MSSSFTNDSNNVVQNFDCHQDFNNKFDKTFNDKALENSVKKDSFNRQ